MQTRGSAPLFWEQKGKTVSSLNGRPRLSRAMELTLPALRRHLEQQADVYGAPLLLSLLGQKGDDGEAELAASFGAGVQQLAEGSGGGSGAAPLRARLVAFDFHAQCKPSRADGLRALVQPLLRERATYPPYRPAPRFRAL